MSDIIEEVKSRVVKYHRDTAQGRYEEAVAMYAPNFNVYASNGVIHTVNRPGIDSSNLVRVFQTLHDQGARLCVGPNYIEVDAEDDTAVVTFMGQGFEIAPSTGQQRMEVCRRTTQVWTRPSGSTSVDDWKLCHMHSSDLKPAADLDFSALDGGVEEL